MTREEWEQATDPEALWDALPETLPDRRFFHFTNAMVQAAPVPLNADQRQFLDVLTWVSRRKTTKPERRGILGALSSAVHGDLGGAVGAVMNLLPVGSVFLARQTMQMVLAVTETDREPFLATVCHLHRELLGPARGLSVWDPAWATADVLQMAVDIDQDQDWARLPILADLLEEAGCSCEMTLTHLRDPRIAHSPGCWVLAQIQETQSARDEQSRARTVPEKTPTTI